MSIAPALAVSLLDSGAGALGLFLAFALIATFATWRGPRRKQVLCAVLVATGLAGSLAMATSASATEAPNCPSLNPAGVPRGPSGATTNALPASSPAPSRTLGLSNAAGPAAGTSPTAATGGQSAPGTGAGAPALGAYAGTSATLPFTGAHAGALAVFATCMMVIGVWLRRRSAQRT